MRLPKIAMCVALALTGAVATQRVQAQAGTITGVVTNKDTQQPIAGAQVTVEGTTLGQITNDQGRYLINRVPPGKHAVSAQFVGFAQARQADVNVTAGGTATVDFVMSPTALTLEELVVTGVTDPIAGIKVPFSVGKVSKENIATVPTTNSAAASVQGKVAGASIVRGGGQPGTGVDVMLRTPTSIEGGNSPLFVVDGVILSNTIGGTTVDLESLDIENVEVVKGAAAASLYGSRAAAGVISITTSRGRSLDLDQTRITLRSEYGATSAPKNLPLSTHHQYLQDAQGNWLDKDGNVVTRDLREIAPDDFMDNPYTDGRIYNNIDTYFRAGQFVTSTLNMAYSGAKTNFLTSGNFYREQGALETNDGFKRYDVRVNLDHRLGDKFSLSLSGFHSRYNRDLLINNTGEGGLFWDLLLIEPDVNLDARDANGNFIQQPDPTVSLENPLWSEQVNQETEWRVRTLGNIDGRWNPLTWLNFQGSVSYDRSDEHYEFYTPKGTPTSITQDIPSDGYLRRDNTYADVFNAAASATVLRNFGQLTTRTTLRGLLEREKNQFVRAQGQDFYVVGVTDLGTAQTRTVNSDLEEIRANGLFLQTGLTYANKYIGDLLVRRDGSSLFGPDQRWQTYYRAGFSWVMSSEPWWPFDALNQFKVRYAVGTAGSRPGFNAQYETWSVSSSGSVTKNRLGNKDLKPAFTRERSFGVDFIALNKYQVQLTYAKQTTKDQIIDLPLSSVLGYASQWSNAGIQSGTTLEATLEAQLVDRPGFNWTSTLVADHSASKIDEWDTTCYFNQLRRVCQGASLYDMWGESFLHTKAEIAAKHPGAESEFDVNDDGYVVWVGSGHTWKDGVSQDLWDTSGEVDGVNYAWGIPILARDSLGFPTVSKIGSSKPNVNLGWLNNFNYKGVLLHTAFQAQIGGNVYNGTRQRLYQHERHEDLDQTGKSDETKKPVAYYQAVYNANVNTDAFVEPGSFLKLRELALQYRLRRDQLSKLGMANMANAITLGITGRNVLTLTNYSGFDPEVGSILNRRDTFAYPNTRTWSATVEITF